MGTRYLPSGVKRKGREVEHSFKFISGVKNGRIIHPLPCKPLWLVSELITRGDKLMFIFMYIIRYLYAIIS
jgi:hypothetical protein